MEFKNFDILLDETLTARVTLAAGGAPTQPVPLELDIDAMVRQYEQLLARPNLQEDDLKTLGRQIFRALFVDDILAQFYESVGRIGQTGGLRIRLLLEDPRLARLPWELIYTPREDFLAANARFSFCRFIPASQVYRPLPIQLPLRILVVVSSPKDYPDLDFESERQAIEAGLETMLSTQGVDLQYEYDARRERILERLQQEAFHALHFIGHGDVIQGEGFAMLEDPAGQSDPAAAQEFSSLLTAGRDLRLVVLNACSSAKETARAGFNSLASQLVRRGAPAVVAMRNPVEDRIAIAFSRHLYGNLASGEAVDVALMRTRQQLRLEQGATPGAFGNPVLYLNTEDGRLFEITRSRLDRPVQLAQQVLRLCETGDALAEWKELHDLLQLLTQPLNLIYSMANNPQAGAFLPGIWAQFTDVMETRLLVFARERVRYIGRRYQEDASGGSGEEWAVRLVDQAAQLDRVVKGEDWTRVRDEAGQIRSLIFKHLSICNRKMVLLVDQVVGIYTEAIAILQRLGAQGGVSYPEVQRDLSDLSERGDRISEWVHLHDLFDRLHVQFATLLVTSALSESLELVAMPWGLLRGTLINELLEKAAQISRIGRAYAEEPDGSLRGEAWVVDIKRMGDQLEQAIQAQNLASARKNISELGRLIDQHYLQVDRKIKAEMADFTKLSFALQARVMP